MSRQSTMRHVVAGTVLLATALPSAAAGSLGNAWDIPMATYVYRRDFFLSEGHPYVFEARVTPGSGSDVTMHLWSTTRREEVRRASICVWNVRNACFDYTPPAGATGWYTLVIRPSDNLTAGGPFEVYQSGAHIGGARLGGYIQELESTDIGGAHLSTVLVPGGTPDTYMLLLEGDRLVAMDDDTGVGLASYVRVPFHTTSPDLRAVVGTYSSRQNGSARLVLNDAWIERWEYGYIRDADRDGLGDDLERALRTCPDWATAYPSSGPPEPDWICGDHRDPADTDEDAIGDCAEVFGIWEQGADPEALLPAWGADPRHKDIFIETDWCGDDAGCPTGPHLLHGAAERITDVYAVLPGGSIRNPDGTDGVAVHIDAGLALAPAGGASDTRWGNWGGSNCVPRSPGCPDRDTARAANMAANRMAVFHYAFLNDYDGGGNAGVGLTLNAGRAWSAIAHELGHNLALGHERPGEAATVDDFLNCKPHYQSIMNYAYSGGGLGFSEGRYASAVLDRMALDETYGLGTGTSTSLDFLRTGFGLDVSPTGGVDWNLDGQFTSPVPALLNFIQASCSTFHRGGGYLAGGVDSTPAIAVIGNVYYLFYVRDGTLYRRREVRSAPFPATQDEDSETLGGPDRWTWSAEESFAWLPTDVSDTAAERFRGADGTWWAMVAYRRTDGSVGAFAIRYDALTGVDVVRDLGRLRRDAAAFVSADRRVLEMEEYDDRLWLGYLTSGDLRFVRMDRAMRWSEEAPALDPDGAAIRSAYAGIGLARGGFSDDELLLAAAWWDVDPVRGLCPRLQLFQYFAAFDRWWPAPGRLPDAPCTTTRPTMIFRAERGHSTNGGWYMLVYRPLPDLGDSVGGIPPEVRITDRNGVFLAWPRGHLHNEWTNLSDEPDRGVALARAGADGGAIVGAMLWRVGPRTTIRDRLDFLPYADGLVDTRARDYDDAAFIRRGLCYAVHGWLNPACLPRCPGCMTLPPLPEPGPWVCP